MDRRLEKFLLHEHQIREVYLGVAIAVGITLAHIAYAIPVAISLLHLTGTACSRTFRVA
jgi:hypothetical protein